MYCPKGSEVRESEHCVKTLDKAREWFVGCKNYDLPILVRQYTSSEGRVLIKVFDNNRKLIHTRG